ncbi:Cellulose synthase [Corchorus olitorius]|uniref:Cellulose synthase n=1 Tax=Corchorus olitorius TaxID=93759 RepID=A0A1R3KML1_9ROSI|nr:Cellulose synthase [Corchorus olitorius]
MSPWLLAFLCESWFTIYWGIIVNCKWNPMDYKTYPENLDKRFPDLPNVDMFVTTADPVLEPPIITVNTILSLLAVDYPAQKLACYVSDDGCSPLTFYSVVEASKFAKLWVPFCKKYNIQVRAPFRYFLGDSDHPSNAYKANSEFHQDWLKMKVTRKPVPCDLNGEFADFSDVERRNHSTIVKIMWYRIWFTCREKRPKQPHNYKAGAMNVLGRVSGVMTNAPFMLNVDCDMFVNNPQVVRHAMCQLLGCPSEEIAFVQYPQVFYGSPRDDPYGNQFVVVSHYIARGITGIRGYDMREQAVSIDEKSYMMKLELGKLVDETVLRKEFGNSEEFINSATQALKGKQGAFPNLSNSLEAACEVASCNYEHGTSWGTKLGWIYGSTVEDLHTGLVIHNKGWNSTLHGPEPPAFMGCALSGGPKAMTQQKRWVTGLLEIMIGKNSPIFSTLTTNLQFRMCLAYLWILVWALHSVHELLYATLPAYCILTNSRFLPKVEETTIWIPTAVFLTYNLHNLREHYSCIAAPYLSACASIKVAIAISWGAGGRAKGGLL